MSKSYELTEASHAVASARSLLFVPGNRPERFSKAATSGADGIVLDLEDSVPAADKAAARANVEQWLRSGGNGLVRVNATGSPWYHDDVATLSHHPCGIMLPKSEGEAEIRQLFEELPAGSFVIPLLETARGILDARSVASARGVVRVAFGNGDLAAELGVDHADWAALAWPRGAIIVASAACGIASPLDGVTTDLDDESSLAEDSSRAAALGFTGKLCVHPRQVDIVHSFMGPSHEQIRWAEEVIAASEAGGVTTLRGQMIEKPIVDRALGILDRAP